MSAGERNRRIDFVRLDTATDDYGGEIESAPDQVAGVFAKVMFGTGQERREAAQEAGSQAATFIVLWTPKLDAVGVTDRIRFDGADWDITNIAPVGLNRELHFTATRRV